MLAERVLAALPIAELMLRRPGQRFAVLAYHGVPDGDAFSAQVAWLRRRMQPITLDEAIDIAHGRGEAPRRGVLLTFDDGHREVLDTALPILQQHGVPAVAFVIAGSVTRGEPFWWDEVEQLVGSGAARLTGDDPRSPAEIIRWMKEVPNADRVRAIERLRSVDASLPVRQLTPQDLQTLSSGGIAVANHTDTHPVLDRCPDDVLEAEITYCHDFLMELLGYHPRAFAYPNGNVDRRAQKHLLELGYEIAFLFDHRAQRIPVDDALAVSRLRISSDAAVEKLKLVASGVLPAIHQMRGRR